MHDQFRKSNQTVRDVTTLQHVFDIRNWIGPCLDEIHRHTIPHVFLFKRNAEGRAEMFYKQWSHKPWEPSGSGLKLLKVNNALSCLN